MASLDHPYHSSPTSPRVHKRTGLQRGFSHSLRQYQSRQEQEHLLGADPEHGHHGHGHHHESDEEHADSDGLYPPHQCWTADEVNPPDPNRNCRVYENIHRIRRDLLNSVDDPYSLDQLKTPRMNLTLVRPLVDTYYTLSESDASIVYCLLVNRTQFIREQSYATHHQTINLTRALLCELIAEKLLRRFNERHPGPKGLLRLANIMVAGFEPFQNAPQSVVRENTHALHWALQHNRPDKNKLTALEVAIVSESKSFLASGACQKVVDAIYQGKIVYTPSSFIDILPDNWKRRPISLYDPRRGPRLNQYRLIVPRTRNVIEVGQFVVLLVLYVMVMTRRESRLTTDYSPWECVFDVYAAGWVLDQFASMLEHGWQVYSQNLWSFLDCTFSLIFGMYFILRMHAFNISDADKSVKMARNALDILSVAAPILIPRLAFNIMSENMLFLSLRAMMSDFLTLTALAVWSFAGFLLSMKWLHNGAHKMITISKWMIWIWFGLDGTGIQESPDFHWFLGPVIMITFAFLGNTLFLTILVSMLSNTFSIIVANAVPEIQFRRAVLTFEGVKSDAIFAYMPPFNMVAMVVMLPLKFLLSARNFHRVHVCAVRVLNFPLLLLISWYERRTLWRTDHKHNRGGRPKAVDWKRSDGPGVVSSGAWARTLTFWDVSRFSVHGDIQAVFDTVPPQEVLDMIAEEDTEEHGPAGLGRSLRDELNRQFPLPTELSPTRLGSQSQRGSEDKRKPSGSRRRKQSEESTEPGREFMGSSDESEDSDGHPKGHGLVKRKERMDSVMAFDDSGAMAEANARLHKLEDSVGRIETLLMEMMNADDKPIVGEEVVDPDLPDE